MTPCRAAAAMLLLALSLHTPAAEPAQPEALPGVDLSGLSPEQQKILVDWSKSAFCYCGCPHTVGQCLRGHRTCRHAARMMTLAARLVRAGAKKEELDRLVSSYYASFDRRVKIDVSKFGPPLGNPSAPVTIVEWSDFTCPYCQAVRPTLEAFVEAHKDRVKLIYKPFPIEGHPGAQELAQAGEWARDANLFWPMHDAMFGSPGSHSPDELASFAADAGGDPSSLKAALESGKYAAKVKESQAEARAAGIKGTPSLFMNGRPLLLTDYSEEWLEFTLQDEEEWVKHGTWQKD